MAFSINWITKRKKYYFFTRCIIYQSEFVTLYPPPPRSRESEDTEAMPNHAKSLTSNRRGEAFGLHPLCYYSGRYPSWNCFSALCHGISYEYPMLLWDMLSKLRSIVRVRGHNSSILLTSCVRFSLSSDIFFVRRVGLGNLRCVLFQSVFIEERKCWLKVEKVCPILWWNKFQYIKNIPNFFKEILMGFAKVSFFQQNNPKGLM